MSSCCSINKQEKPKVSVTDKIKPYYPLIVMTVLIIACSSAISLSNNLTWMPLFMGLFLFNFSMLKLFDVKGFAKSFASYDYIAKRSKIYAVSYPFIELALAVSYLTISDLFIVNIITAVIMAVGLIGVINIKLKKIETKCACMGSFIDVPVGFVTILENTTMLLMALYMAFAI